MEMHNEESIYLDHDAKAIRLEAELTQRQQRLIRTAKPVMAGLLDG